MVGLTLGRLGAAPVVITDNEPELVTLMAKNIEDASGNMWKFGIFGSLVMHSVASDV